MIQVNSKEETLFIEWVHMKRKNNLLKRLRLNKVKRAERRRKETRKQINKHIEDIQCTK